MGSTRGIGLYRRFNTYGIPTSLSLCGALMG